MSTGYTPERAAFHDSEVDRIVMILGKRGYLPKALEVDGHRPDIQLGNGDYIDVKTKGPNLAIEINCIVEANHIVSTEKKRVYYIHSINSDLWVTDINMLRPLSGPNRRSGNGSNDDWYLFEPANKSGTAFDLFFPDKFASIPRAIDLI
jgi:hypothetical protein